MSDAAQTPRRPRSLLVAAMFALAGFVALMSLGVWQLQRLAWKEDIVARMESRLKAPAKPLPPSSEWARLVLEENEYERFSVAGVFDRAREALIYRPTGKIAGALAQPGYWVMTPLRLRDGALLLINRGFVPLAAKDPASRPPPPAGEVTITGLLRGPEPRGAFTPADAPAKGEWYTRDPEAIARALQLERAAPFSLDEDAHPGPPGAPLGGATVVDIPNNHLSYALTWFGLAATLAVFFLVFALRQRRPA